MKDWVGNGNSIFKTIGSSAHTDKEREVNDYYATDPIAIDKLLSVEMPSSNIWECACGEGHLSERLKEKGYHVISTDLIDRGYADETRDFLTAERGYKGYDILTNPPYKYATEFVVKALELLDEGRKAYMFLKLTFLEGKARFEKIFKSTPPPCGIRIHKAHYLRQKRRFYGYGRCRRWSGLLRLVCVAKGL